MVKKTKSTGEEVEDDLSLVEVLKLGGTKEDFEFLKDVKDDDKLKTPKIEDTLKDNEFLEFFKSVGFDEIAEVSDEDDDEIEVGNNVHQKKSKEPIKDARKRLKNKGTAISILEDKEKNVSKNKVPTPNLAPLQDDQITSTTGDRITATSHSELPAKVYNHIWELAKIMPRKMMCKCEVPWHESDIFKMSASPKFSNPNDPSVVNLKTLGSKLLENEASLYKNRKQSSSGNDPWLRTVVTSGTLSDRVAAYTLMLQKAPLHSYWCLDMFLSMLKKKGKREALIGLESARDIFLAELLPDERRLRFFYQQPLEVLKKVFQQEKGGATSKRLEIQKYLIHWTLEDHIKTSYKQLVESLRDFFLQDSIEAFKTRGMKVAMDLLKSKPEQERELLTMLVNKLGDPKHKIASKALHMLHCLIQEHPLMQIVIIGTVRDVLLRPNVQPKCQYYCICFLSAQILSHDRKDVADLLIQIYLGFFKAAVKKTQVDNKLLSAILTGVNRAYPYANTDDEKIMEELNVLFKTVHVSNFGTAVQALMLLFQVLSSRDELSDRFYNALYSALLHPELRICTNRHPMFLNLIFRSLKADSSRARVRAFLKRLLQTCSLQLPSYTSAVLVLMTELLRINPSLKACFENDQGYSRAKADEDITTISIGAIDEDDDDEEHFVDVDKKVEDTNTGVQDESNTDIKNSEISWTHLHKKSLHCRSSDYDPTHRNPVFANADKLSLWEMQQIRRHFHPTVVKFATELADIKNSGIPDQYPGDPLQDFSLMRFLDKFVYRNPKAKQNKEAQANIGDSVFRRKRTLTMAETQAVAANTPEFLQKKSFNPEEVFLQRYFTSRAGDVAKVKPRKTEDDDGGDVEDISDDEFDRFLTSSEGKAEVESQINFAHGTTGPKTKKQKMNEDESSDDDEEDGENDELDDDFEDGVVENFGEEDPSSEKGMAFTNVDDEDEHEPKSNRVKKQKSSKADVEAFGMMLEENSRSKANTSGSGAVRNTDRSSARQLQWEQKKETKEIVARKRARKLADGFSKGGKRQKFNGKRNKNFSGRKKKGRAR